MSFETIKDKCPHKIDRDGIMTCDKRKLVTLGDSLCTEMHCDKAPSTVNNETMLGLEKLIKEGRVYYRNDGIFVAELHDPDIYCEARTLVELVSKARALMEK